MPVFIIETEDEISKEQIWEAVIEAVEDAGGPYAPAVTVIQVR